MKFCQFVASLYPHISNGFGRFILIFNKMALIFLRVLIVFTVLKFRVSTSQIALTSSLMTSGSNSSNLSPLDYQVSGQCWSFNTRCNRSQTSSRVLKCT